MSAEAKTPEARRARAAAVFNRLQAEGRASALKAALHGVAAARAAAWIRAHATWAALVAPAPAENFGVPGLGSRRVVRLAEETEGGK